MHFPPFWMEGRTLYEAQSGFFQEHVKQWKIRIVQVVQRFRKMMFERDEHANRYQDSILLTFLFCELARRCFQVWFAFINN